MIHSRHILALCLGASACLPSIDGASGGNVPRAIASDQAEVHHLHAGESAPLAPVTGLLFVAPDIRNPDLLLRGIAKGTRIVLLREGEELDHMAAEAARHGDLSSIAVLSHATPGRLILSGAEHDTQSLRQSGAALRVIAQSLRPGGDLLFLGCDLAAGEDGQRFVEEVGRLAGADIDIDIAASRDATGHASLGGNWELEVATGPIEAPIPIAMDARQAWADLLTVTVTTAANATAMRNAMGAPGTNGVTYSGTPSLNAAAATGAFGTFTTTSSNLGLARGAILGTGNVTQVPGTPGTFWTGAGTGISGAGSEFDIARLTYSFRPNTGVTKVVFQFAMGSEEYNEYVGQGYSDNLLVLLSGGVYSNTNVALVPGTATGVDIDTINAAVNSAFYRNNEVAPVPVPDSVLDGHTVVISPVRTVVPGTTYSVTYSVADVLDNAYNSAAFLGFFGASIFLDLDGNDSSGATGTSFVAAYTDGGAPVAVADTDRIITNYDTTSIQSARIVLTNAQAGDGLAIGSLPAGITGTINTATPGQITVTLSGAASAAAYQSAISAVTFANANTQPSTTARNVTVTVNDGTTDSNTAVATINVTLRPADLVTVKTLASGDSTPPAGSLVTYHVTVTNNGPGPAANITLSDALPANLTATPNNGTATAGSYAGPTWTIPELASGASATLTLEGTVNAVPGGTVITNTTTAAISNRSDPTNAGNDLSESVTTTAPLADLVTVKTLASGNPAPAEGDTVTFAVTVTNNGPSIATAITLTDLLPSGLTATPGNGAVTAGSYVPGTGLWSIPALGIGASAVLTLEGTVDAGTSGDPISNTTTLATGAEPDPGTTGNDLSEAVTVANETDLVVAKTVDNPAPFEGETVAFTITATNNGPARATGLSLTDLLPAGLSFVSAAPGTGTYDSSTGIWTIGSLDDGSTATLVLSASVAAGTGGNAIENAVTAVTMDQIDTNLSADDPAETITVVAQIDLDSGLALSDPAPFFGDTVTLAATITNQGIIGATGVAAMLVLPDGFAHVSDTAGGAYNPGTGLWNLGALGAGASASIDLVLVPVDGTSHEITLEVTAADTPDLDSDPATGFAVDDLGDAIPDDDEAVVTAAPSLSPGTPLPPPVCTGSVAALVDWDATPWPAGQISGTTTRAGIDVTIAVSDPAGALSGSLFGPMPVGAPFYQGGLATTETALAFDLSDAGLAINDLETEITFSQPVSEIRLSLFDLDFSYDGTFRIEEVDVAAFNGAAPVGVALDGGGAISVFGNRAVGIADSPTTGSSSGAGTLMIGLAGPADRIVITFGHAPGTNRTSGRPGMAIHDIAFCAPSLPDIAVLKTYIFSADANGNGQAGAGDVIEYSYTITNTGNDALLDVTLTDIHDGLGAFAAPDIESATLDTQGLPGASVNANALNNAWDQLAPGHRLVVTATYPVVQADLDSQ